MLVLLMLGMGGCRPAQMRRSTKIAGLAQLGVERQDAVASGRELYEQYCAGCHGADGNGRGPGAAMLLTKPRDFTKGNFKFKRTPSGTLPTDEDVLRTIGQGVARTSMPAWSLLPDRERRLVLEYLKTFSGRWRTEAAGRPISLPEPPEFLGNADSVARGKALYGRMQCGKCHGETGRGDGPSAEGLTDAENNPIRVFDFTIGLLKGGRSVQDVYRTFTTGLDGTPMPSYGDVLGDAERWHLVSYVLHLMRKTRVGDEDLKRAEQALGSGAAH
jgi:cytochrome c oxidase cbb3-type subunit 2